MNVSSSSMTCAAVADMQLVLLAISKGKRRRRDDLSDVNDTDQERQRRPSKPRENVRELAIFRRRLMMVIYVDRSHEV